MANESWRHEFPRLHELYRSSDQTQPDNYFIRVFQHYFEYDRDLTQMSFGPLEKALECLTLEAWSHLVEKALPWVNQRHPCRQWSQLFNHLYEAFGYEWLSKQGYTEIRFMPRRDKESKRTADLLGKSATSTAILEVKTINCSELEIDMHEMSPPPVIDLAQGLPSGFKNKFLDDVRNAREQMEKVDEPTDRQIALVVIRMDCGFWLCDSIYREIDELASTHLRHVCILTVPPECWCLVPHG